MQKERKVDKHQRFFGILHVIGSFLTKIAEK